MNDCHISEEKTGLDFNVQFTMYVSLKGATVNERSECKRLSNRETELHLLVAKAGLHPDKVKLYI